MRITRLRTEVVQIPFTPVIGEGSALALRSSDCVLVYLETDQGLVGEGLCFTLNNRRVAVIREMIHSFEPLIVGLDPQLGGSFSARAWSDINFIGHSGVSIFGMAGIDNALWDLRGKAADMNVSRLLGACREAMPVYHSGGLWMEMPVDELQRAAAGYVKQGYRAMKMRLGRSPQEDAARARAVREAIGPDIALMSDSNQRWTVPQAIQRGRLLEEFNLAWFEEPIAYLDHAGEAAVAAALAMPLASGETEYTWRGMHRMLELRSADILMPDLQRMGGPTGFLKAAHVAEAYDTPVSSHLFPEMNLALLASLPNAIYLEYMPWFEPLYRERIELNGDGEAIVPLRPGWGFSFDPAAVARYRVR
ncbi:MAG: mandelate racemase/muconate lactonizing enzyme family protein [Betaproteobacteria bacterium]|nr:mandelate racemase/muconate lactonizing enzyme family protein [Betaproteobacteria bacterium]